MYSIKDKESSSDVLREIYLHHFCHDVQDCEELKDAAEVSNYDSYLYSTKTILYIMGGAFLISFILFFEMLRRYYKPRTVETSSSSNPTRVWHPRGRFPARRVRTGNNSNNNREAVINTQDTGPPPSYESIFLPQDGNPDEQIEIPPPDYVEALAMSANNYEHCIINYPNETNQN